MSKRTTKQNEIAKRYGGVLFDLAQTHKVLEEVSTDAHRLTACLLQEPREWTFIASPVMSSKAQVQVIQKMAVMLKLGKLMINFLKVVCHNHRLQDILFILEDFTARCKAATGVIDGTIETAVELPSQTITHLSKSLKQRLGKDVILHPSVDKTLLGGLVIRIGSFMIDASLKTQLNKLGQELKR